MRRRLAFLVAATMALVLVAFVVPLAFLVRVIVADRAVTVATSQAQQLGAEVAADSEPSSLRTSVQLASTGRPLTVFLPHNVVIGSRAPRDAAVQLAEQKHGSISVSTAGGREILFAVVGVSNGTAVVRTFVTSAELSHGVTQAWLVLAALGLVLLALGVVVADRLLGTVTRPIGELARLSHRLADGELDARASLDGPAEVRDVAQALNHLAGRIRDQILQEREHVADLSHRLRTPLTALRLEAEAAGAAADPDGRLAAQVQALEDAVASLIEDARRRSDGPGNCDAGKVMTERAAFWSVLADDQGRRMLVEVPPVPVPVGVAAAELAAALDALLGNVFAHTPEGAGFAIRLAASAAGGGVLTIADTGPGFDQAGDPVRRGASGGGSTGLGLDIVRKAAEASGGSLTVRNGLRGAEVIAVCGPPQPDRRPS